MSNNQPIGIFDSGVGGLTVYRALREKLPHEDFIYLGDTARLPYGTKTPETIARYAQEITERLTQENIKMLVIACNTATAHGLAHLRSLWPVLPCLGVITPGAQAAAAATQNGRVVVLATEGTVRSGAYQKALRRINPSFEVEGIGCNLLAALVEEGWENSAEGDALIRRYLSQITMKDYDTLVLGCTHFPILADAIKRLIPTSVRVIDSANTTAVAAADYLAERGMLNGQTSAGSSRFLVTDGLARFQSVMQRFSGGLAGEAVGLVSLPQAVDKVESARITA